MGKLLCEKNLRDVWCRNESVPAEIGQIVHTHTHTAKLVVEIKECINTHVRGLKGTCNPAVKNALGPLNGVHCNISDHSIQFLGSFDNYLRPFTL